jgi:hypothetical protein
MGCTFSDATLRAQEFGRPAGNHRPEIHRSTTLEQFIDLGHDPNICGNLLDMKSFLGQVPGLIS